jgi:hypothetical protein
MRPRANVRTGGPVPRPGGREKTPGEGTGPTTQTLESSAIQAALGGNAIHLGVSLWGWGGLSPSRPVTHRCTLGRVRDSRPTSESEGSRPSSAFALLRRDERAGLQDSRCCPARGSGETMALKAPHRFPFGAVRQGQRGNLRDGTGEDARTATRRARRVRTTCRRTRTPTLERRSKAAGAPSAR